MFSKFFIDRPIFATVVSLVFVLAGLVSMKVLPIEQYPNIVPTEIQISATYPGATAEVLADTVAAPIEQEVNGVGYRAEKKGNQLVMSLGFSHPVIVDEIPGITIEVPAANKVIIRGIDKQVVGQVAANIRKLRAPDPYKGKGIKYADEDIRRKVGKTGKK